MSNPSKDHPSVRVQAPPGGHSNNIFSTSEFEQSAANKKKHMQSNIFGTNQDNVDPAPVKQTRATGNNIIGSDHQETGPTAGTLAGQYKQSQMKSNIFGTDEPTSTRAVSDKNKSNIFGIGDNDDPHKRQQGGIRRVGYNPINGESYGVNSKTNENEKQPEPTVKAAEEPNGNAQAPAENGSAQATAPPATNPTENVNAQAVPAETTATVSAQAPPAEAKNGQKVDNAQKNVHTSVRVFHPPGGKSNGPLW
jgi:hypothetical protein